MDNRKRFYQELTIAIALGSIPVFMAYGVGGVELLDTAIKAQMPSDFLLWYLMFLPAPYVLAVAIDRWIWKKNDLMKARSAFWRSTWREIGTAFHSLWRALAGVLMAIPVLWAYVEYNTFQLGKGVLFFGLGIALLAQCCFFSRARSLLEGTPS